MNEKYKKIEKLNLDYLNLINSKEYKSGKNLYKLKDKSLLWLQKKIVNNYKIKKLNKKTNMNNEYYSPDISIPQDIKIVVYTCITGNYDTLKDPFIINKNIDYIAFSDDLQLSQNTKWKIYNIPDNIKNMDNILINRYIKMHPHILFPNYDYSIYLDGNVEIISDLSNLISATYNMKSGIAMHRHQLRDCIYDEVKACKILKKGNYKKMDKQITKYKIEGFPKKFGMLEATVIVSNLKNINTAKIMEKWWKEFKNSESMRDQIALHYVIWKLGYTLDDFGNLGNNVYMNPKFRIKIH